MKGQLIFSYLTIIGLTFLICTINTQLNCNQKNTLRGCINCLATNYLSLNETSRQMTCTTFQNCVAVNNQGDSCTVCSIGYALDFTTATNITACSIKNGCKTMVDSICTQCITPLYYLNSTADICEPILIDYCWIISESSCSECSDQNIGTTSNCSINSSLCLSFNYITWTCQVCPALTTLHSSGVYCITSDPNCLIYSLNTCILCMERYFYNQTTLLCQSGVSRNFDAEVLAANHNYLASGVSEKVRFCLNNNQYFDSTTNNCIQTTSNISNCLTSITTVCTQCLQKFFLYNGICKSCTLYDNCKKCDRYNCLLCQLQYYLVITDNQYTIDQVYKGITVQTTKCLPCSIYGCLYCRNQFNINGIDQLLCDKCLFGYLLYDNTCYSCPQGTYYSIITKQCLACSVANCQYCNTNPLTCDQCIGNVYYTNNVCSINITSVNTFSNIVGLYQILNKSVTYGSRYINNDEKLLITSCQGDSNGYACLCDIPSGTIYYSALCYAISPNLLTISLTTIEPIMDNYTLPEFIQNLPTLKLLSELPNFDYLYLLQANQLLSPKQFVSYLQMTVNLVRDLGQNGTVQQAFKNWIFNSQSKTFNPQNSTIFSGPGFYFKYSPKNVVSDDSSLVTISDKANASMILVFFNSTIDPTIKRITGDIYVFMDSTVSQNISITIKKVSFLQNNQAYVTYNKNGAVQNLPISSNSDGYLIISSYATPTTFPTPYIFVSSIVSSSSADLYASQRIENIIYQQAFIYILIVVGLYLTFIPMCAFTDCVDNKSSKRVVNKSATQQKESFQGIQKSQQSGREDEVVLKINYRDFFPIYNIANTPRPKRFVKLCLFIVNCQHSVTIMVLIYFRFAAGQPIAAILLAIPGYLVTIILGYLCGLLVLKLPKYTKYLINLVTLGYWAIWIALMPKFLSNEYKPYIYIFALIFFLIDMTIDFLQTLLMYFTIKQQEKQITLFKVLSKFLSYRGYYEFDQMARQINDIRNNDDL